MKIVAGLATLAALVLGGWAFLLKNQVQSLQSKEELMTIQTTMLRDELRSVELKLMTQPTYDDGYVAAMKRSEQNSEYVEGYHRAMSQIFSNPERTKQASQPATN